MVKLQSPDMNQSLSPQDHFDRVNMEDLQTKTKGNPSGGLKSLQIPG